MTVSADGRDWQFDHIDPSLPPRMNEVFSAIRERCPIVHSDRHGGFWAVLSHDAVREAALDTRTYSSVGGVTLPPEAIAIILGLPPEDGELFVSFTTRIFVAVAAVERPRLIPRMIEELAFGLGVHRCLGEHLALLEMRIVAEEILRLAPNYRLAGDFAPQWIPGRMMRGLASLPVDF